MAEFITFTASKDLSKNISKLIGKYIESSNIALRKAAFTVYGICQKDFLSIQDGESRRTKYVRPTKRTTFEGLRRPTGTLARAIKVGVYDSTGRLTILNSASGVLPKDKFLVSASVGIGNEVPYGVMQERYGRQKLRRKDGFFKFHPFLSPALEKSKPEIKDIFDAEMKAANRK